MGRETNAAVSETENQRECEIMGMRKGQHRNPENYKAGPSALTSEEKVNVKSRMLMNAYVTIKNQRKSELSMG